jgi:hypothetical protein
MVTSVWYSWHGQFSNEALNTLHAEAPLGPFKLWREVWADPF